MAAHEPTVLVSVVQMVLQTAAVLNLDRADLLVAAGLTEADLRNRDGQIPIARMVSLARAVSEARPNVNLGLAALDYFHPSTLGVLGYMVSHGAVLADSLDAFVRYQNLLSPAVRWHVTRGPVCTVRIEAAPPLQALGFPLEAQVGLWVVLGRHLTGVEWSPTRIGLRHHPRGPAEEFTARLGCAVEFGANENTLEFDAEVLSLPVVGARPELQPSLARLVETQLSAAAPPEPDFTSRSRALLLEALPRGLTSKDEVARRLAVSPRTLTRRLAEEGSSFRGVLEEVRETLARAWLSDPAVAIHEIAYLLGYAEPSTFHRSFRRWTGATPSAWRRRHHRPSDDAKVEARARQRRPGS